MRDDLEQENSDLAQHNVILKQVLERLYEAGCRVAQKVEDSAHGDRFRDALDDAANVLGKF